MDSSGSREPTQTQTTRTPAAERKTATETEYHYQHNGFLLRVTGVVKPSQAKAYESVFDAQFEGS